MMSDITFLVQEITENISAKQALSTSQMLAKIYKSEAMMTFLNSSVLNDVL